MVPRLLQRRLSLSPPPLPAPSFHCEPGKHGQHARTGWLSQSAMARADAHPGLSNAEGRVWHRGITMARQVPICCCVTCGGSWVMEARPEATPSRNGQLTESAVRCHTQQRSRAG